MKTNFWLGIGAGQEAQRFKPADGQKPSGKRSIIVGAAIAVLVVAGLTLVFLSHLHF